jgi:hypothetical protein
MARFPIVLLFFLAFTGPILAQEAGKGAAPSPEIVSFAESITGVTWKSRGTFQVKGVRFDGESLAPIRENGESLRPYDTYFPDAGLIRVVYADGTTSWYLFSDDLKYVTSVKVLSERTFALPEGAVAKPVKRFPEDLEGVVFESTDNGPDRVAAKMRWNGKELEFAALQGNEWKTERQRAVVADRRVFETQPAEDVIVWFVYHSDGSEAWFLQIENIFGGHRAEVPPVSSFTPADSGLNEQQNDLANHLMDLQAAGVKEPAGTLQRQFERKLRDQPDLLKSLRTRWGGR